MTEFPQRQIGRTALRVTELGLGCATLGGSQIAVARAAAEEIVGAAWAAGVRYVDTAPYYGVGQAERCVGDALRDRPRGEWVLSTKVGRLLRRNPTGAFADERRHALTFEAVYDYSYDGIDASPLTEQSNTRPGAVSISRVSIMGAIRTFIDRREARTRSRLGGGGQSGFRWGRFFRASGRSPGSLDEVVDDRRAWQSEIRFTDVPLCLCQSLSSSSIRADTRNGGQRCGWVSSMRVRNTGSAVASAKPTVSPARISCVKSSASRTIVIGIFTRLLARSARPEWVEQNQLVRRPEGSGVSDSNNPLCAGKNSGRSCPPCGPFSVRRAAGNHK
jgi:hypothetical protein